MPQKRSSKIWQPSKEEFANLIKRCFSFKEALAFFGMENKGQNFRTLRKRILEDNIDYSHFKKPKDYLVRIPTPIEKLLVENSDFNRTHLKEKLFKAGLIRNECYICKQPPIWQGKPLTLQLDHINGISNDNRIENLRILCPHCHSQTETYAGRSKRKN